ncbi:Mitochondrial Protein Translocase (MPT) Family [Thraustotheca clavata]|uniref:Mitochondrial Protein Translocase (MPT) Family n=1 Tax=Thraustotheca clavata TaxID=74557 RepID=A0A1W0ABL0_9STRA|nr:Mitochondrial Protein Translocase (MPT) Family [Thraustotheca clavata]
MSSSGSWNDTEFKADEPFDASSFPVTSSPGFSLPDFGSTSQIDLGVISPVFGVADGATSAADYLEFDVKGRGFHERATHTIGLSYFGGILGGGAYGAAEGLRNSPSRKFKVRMNSLFNAAGQRGSRAGNALGVLALMYSGCQEAVDTLELEQYGVFDKALPIVAAGATGMIYKSTAGTRPMVLAGVIGALFMGAIQFGENVTGIRY